MTPTPLKNELFKQEASTFSEEDIARANQRHDQLFGNSRGHWEIPKNYWIPSPPGLDKRLPDKELNPLVPEWHNNLKEARGVILEIGGA